LNDFSVRKKLQPNEPYTFGVKDLWQELEAARRFCGEGEKWSEDSLNKLKVKQQFYVSMDDGKTIRKVAIVEIEEIIAGKSKEESQYITESVSPPGNTIKELLVERKMKLKEFSIISGLSLKTIFALLNGEIHINFTIAEMLESVFDVPAEFWLQREINYRDSVMQYKSQYNND
jgi:plasmid maintenance system antidote protein VapI